MKRVLRGEFERGGNFWGFGRLALSEGETTEKVCEVHGRGGWIHEPVDFLGRSISVWTRGSPSLHNNSNSSFVRILSAEKIESPNRRFHLIAEKEEGRWWRRWW